VKETIKAVRKDRVLTIIPEEVKKKVLNGEYKCIKCGVPINEQNIGAIKYIDNEYIFYCDKYECLRG
jgi:hypothetical protein